MENKKAVGIACAHGLWYLHISLQQAHCDKATSDSRCYRGTGAR